MHSIIIKHILIIYRLTPYPQIFLQSTSVKVYLKDNNIYMKKALSLISLVAGSIMIASAQVSIGVNGGSVNIGTQATQGQVNGGPLLALLALTQTIVSRLGILAVGVAILAFFWYLIKFITQGGESSDAKSASLKGMGYSILAIFVMVSIWGIVGALGGMLGVGQGGSVPIPGIPVPTN